MKKVVSVTALMTSANVFAHVSESSSTQHASEHVLLAVLLIPLAGLILRKLLK